MVRRGSCSRWLKVLFTHSLLLLTSLQLYAQASASPTGNADNVSLQITRLKSPNPELRQYAADALGKFKDRRATEPLIAALPDADPHVRMMAAIALAQLKDPRAVEPIIELLKDSNDDARDAAELALEQIGDPRAVEPLINLWRSGARLRVDLAVFGPPAIDPLLSALKDKDPAVRRGAADALISFPQPKVLSALEAALKDPDPGVRQEVLLGLSAHADAHREALVRVALNDSARRYAKRPFRQLAGPKTAPWRTP